MHGHQRSAVALRHVAFEDLGLLSSTLNPSEWNVTYCDATIDDLSHSLIENADLLIVLGGPIGVYEVEAYPFLTKEITLLERRLARNKPTLGICLGSQLMAAALGSRVYAGTTKEIGWGRVKLTSDGATSCLADLAREDAMVLHWHGDTFDLPAGAVRLASNTHYENQAFSYGGRALALQFHLEADPRHLERWYVGHAAELAATKVSVPELRAATARIASKLPQQTESIFSCWLKEIA